MYFEVLNYDEEWMAFLCCFWPGHEEVETLLSGTLPGIAAEPKTIAVDVAVSDGKRK